MASWDDVRQIALDLPEAVEDTAGRTTAWRVGAKAFAWERLLRRGEREQLGAAAPEGPALGLRTPDPDAARSFDDLDEALTDAWLCRAPRRLRGPFLEALQGP